MYRTNIQRIMESAAQVARALYTKQINYTEIITAYHHLANTLECTGRKDEAAIVDQIISGYQNLQQSQSDTAVGKQAVTTDPISKSFVLMSKTLNPEHTLDAPLIEPRLLASGVDHNTTKKR